MLAGWPTLDSDSLRYRLQRESPSTPRTGLPAPMMDKTRGVIPRSKPRKSARCPTDLQDSRSEATSIYIPNSMHSLVAMNSNRIRVSLAAKGTLASLLTLRRRSVTPPVGCLPALPALQKLAGNTSS